ncbi:hypothetical protein F2Q69_00062299 [Brassica cretica]|uniref:Uncharacterized protein n=1 Tax=Brassica cretica TaxID=69181 RepID=A0A8S9RGJ0_BRACR|nr:hypothetical protein F2Q69_00062299 [Brassica cretica]
MSLLQITTNSLPLADHAHFFGSWQYHNYRGIRHMRRKPVQDDGYLAEVFGMDNRYWSSRDMKKVLGECRICMDLNTLSPTLIPSNAEEDGFDHHHVKQQYLEDRETFEGENLLT